MMALGAMANDSSVKVKIVPVGLSYFHPHRFRSRAVVEFGAAMDVPEELVNMFKEGGPSKRVAVGNLLDLIYDGLKTVTVRAPDYDTLMVSHNMAFLDHPPIVIFQLIQAARRLYKPPGQHLTLGQVVELNKRFLEGYLQLKDEPKIQDLRNKVLKYNRLLRDLGLRDHQVWQSPNTLGVFKLKREFRSLELPRLGGRHLGCCCTAFSSLPFGRLWLCPESSSMVQYSSWHP